MSPLHCYFQQPYFFSQAHPLFWKKQKVTCLSNYFTVRYKANRGKIYRLLVRKGNYSYIQDGQTINVVATQEHTKKMRNRKREEILLVNPKNPQEAVPMENIKQLLFETSLITFPFLFIEIVMLVLAF